MNTLERVNEAIEARRQAASCIAEVMPKQSGASEIAIRDALADALAAQPDFYTDGWYVPPPRGTAVLLGTSADPSRLLFDSLRKEEHWPSDDHILGNETVGLLHVSPVMHKSGAIGDIGLTWYTGEHQDVKDHINRCLTTLEEAADGIQIGMSFKAIHELGQTAFAKAGLHNDRTLAIHDKSGTNLGHAVPWTYEDPTPDEQLSINGNGAKAVAEAIRAKRVYLNAAEELKVPPTIAFTFEARLESRANPTLPIVYFHLLVTFRNGEREIVSNFNPIYKALGMDYIKSRY